MEKLILASLLLFLTGCTSLVVKRTLAPDGKTVALEITRYSFMAGAAFETVDVPGIGKLQGYQNDGGKGSLAEVGTIAGKITEGAVVGALKSQGK
jgi:hypothetical protein